MLPTDLVNLVCFYTPLSTAHNTIIYGDSCELLPQDETFKIFPLEDACKLLACRETSTLAPAATDHFSSSNFTNASAKVV
jgi:hypothetical protein